MARPRVRLAPGTRSTPKAGLDTFVLLCRVHGLPEPVCEYVFAPPRKFRADYAWPHERVIVEQNGGIWRKGGHSPGRGLLRDYEKLNLAPVLGWRYLVYTPAQLSSGEAIEDLQAVFHVHRER